MLTTASSSFAALSLPDGLGEWTPLPKRRRLSTDVPLELHFRQWRFILSRPQSLEGWIVRQAPLLVPRAIPPPAAAAIWGFGTPDDFH